MVTFQVSIFFYRTAVYMQKVQTELGKNNKRSVCGKSGENEQNLMIQKVITLLNIL